jgi:NitT/TauT family transport system substrate-binding protein
MRSFRVAVVASLVALAATALASAQAKPTVKIGYIPTDSFAALFLLADRHLPAAGVNVETVRLAGGPEIVSQVATGQLQLGGGGMGAAGFNAVVSGLPVEYVAPLHAGYVEDYFVVRKDLWGKDVKRIADLKGRTVALNIRGAAVEWMLDMALRRDGLTIKDVQVKLMPFPDMVPALESGAVDAAILSEPFPTLAEDKGVAVRPLTKAPGAKPVPITAIFWNKEWVKANPELAQRVMGAYLKAARDLALGDGWQGDRTIETIVKFTPAKPEILKKARPHAIDANLEMDASVLDSMQKFNAELGYLKYKELQPVGKLFNFTYRDRAVQEAGKK